MSAAGQFRYIVSIYRNERIKSESGFEKMDLVHKFDTRAKIVHKGGSREYTDGPDVAYPYVFEYTLHSYCDVTEGDVLQDRGKNYRILSIEKRPEYNDQLLKCEIIIE